MSYILDALRRADAERELGDVPTLHTQAVSVTAADDAFAATPDRSWRWAAVVLGLLAMAVAAWFFMGRGTSDSNATLAAGKPVAQSGADVAVPTPTAPPVESVAASAVPAVATPATAPVAPAPVPVAPTSSASVPPTTAPVLASAKTALAGDDKKVIASKALQAPSNKTPSPAAVAAPQNPIPTLNELPEALRREQPKLSVSGAMHSTNPANRMLILNGQVFREGDQVTADLLLEQIKLKSAVLVYKRQRYSISY